MIIIIEMKLILFMLGSLWACSVTITGLPSTISYTVLTVATHSFTYTTPGCTDPTPTFSVETLLPDGLTLAATQIATIDNDSLDLYTNQNSMGGSWKLKISATIDGLDFSGLVVSDVTVTQDCSKVTFNSPTTLPHPTREYKRGAPL